MAPTPQETMVGDSSNPMNKPLSGDDVVISGIAGTFPSADNLNKFMKNLYDKVDMVDTADSRWVFNHPEVPTRLGTISGVDKFDAQFFRVHYKQANYMDPMSRMLLEQTYAAIYDSGTNPAQIRGTKVGVFIGTSFSDSEGTCIYKTVQHNGMGITGCNRAMYANRISYWIDGKGPSYSLDVACSSSMACLQHAYQAISDGRCDAAIVGGCNLCNQPTISLNLRRAGFLSLDGTTKCFDKRGDGYARSDAVNVLFLQKAKDAKRIYCEVFYGKASYSLPPNNRLLPVRRPKEIKEFLEAFYSDINLSPSNVEFVEAHASGIAEADGNELEAIGEVFAKDKPIKVGSVKSNMGHAEPASGVCAATKVCLSYHTGKLPANLHYEQPQDHIAAVRDGKIHILQEHEPFNRGFVALNSFSYAGANIHLLMKGHYKLKDLNRYKSHIPHLICLSGREENCVNKVFEDLKSNSIDPEQIGLLHKFYEHEIPGHVCRGFTIIEPQTSEDQPGVHTLAQDHKYFDGIKRPIWFVYSGMGSQWAGMGSELMKIPIFAAAIEKCRRVLEPKGIDIVNILMNPDKTIYDNILNSFVGIAAVQIGLTDILREMGIVPDHIIGHSVGELGCAYADGCFTAEEMILSAYSRGLVSIQTPFIRGSMAAIGLGYKTILPMCPPEIEVACHNSSESATISGPADIMKEFVGELASKKIFAKEVPCSNIAYHSRYISAAGPGLQKYLSEVITDPKPRTKKWLSTSVPQDMWDTPAAKYSSAEYHTNNLLNSVLFEETSKMIPSNAILIEIAPHGLLQAILKRSLSTECIHVPLTRRGNPNPNKYLLEAIGKLYENGLNPKISVLYPTIEFPVSTGTPFLSHLVGWEHSESWPEGRYITSNMVVPQIRKHVVSIYDDEYKNLEGYVRNGITIYPEAALLVLVWETFAMKREKSIKEMSVVFTNVKFYGEASMNKEKPLKLCVMVHRGNNEFENSDSSMKGMELCKSRRNDTVYLTCLHSSIPVFELSEFYGMNNQILHTDLYSLSVISKNRQGVNQNIVWSRGALIQFWNRFDFQAGSYNTLKIVFQQGMFSRKVSFEKDNGKYDDKRWVLVTGFIREINSKEIRNLELSQEESEDTGNKLTLFTKDIYKIMYQKGYSYKDEFQSIYSTNTNHRSAYIKWTDNWITFIDSIIQLNAFAKDHEGVSVPKLISKLTIDVSKHERQDRNVVKNNVLCYKAVVDPVYDLSQCGGVEMKGLVLNDQPLTENKAVLLTTRDFVPYLLTQKVNVETALNINLQILQENSSQFDIKVTAVINKANAIFINSLEDVSSKITTANIRVKTVEVENLHLDIDILVARDPTITQSDLLIVNNVLQSDTIIMNLHKILKNNAFVLTLEPRTNKLESKYQYFDMITAMYSQNHVFVLLKKSAKILDSNVLYVPIPHDVNFSWVPRVQNELEKKRKVVLVSEKQSYCGLLGLVKALREEFRNNISVVIIDDLRAPPFNPDNKIFRDQLQKGLAFNVLKKGQWGGYYEIPSLKSTNVRNVTLASAVPGNINSLTWVEAQTNVTSQNCVQVQVSYAGPSFRDTMKAGGKIIDDDDAYGMDFSGIDSLGNRVMGVIPNGSISSTVEADPELLWPVPDHWSLEDAATVPLPYLHAYYLLLVKSKLRRKSKVFVHGGVGALGQAVITICLSLDCTVFTTVSDRQKRRFLMKIFPELNETNIGNSCDSTFETLVFEHTKSERCDIVINCTSGHIRKATMNCVGFSGIFLDLNEIEMADNSDFGMSYLYEERTYCASNLRAIFEPRYLEEKQQLQIAISEGIAKGIIRPLTRVVFPTTEVSRAFRLLTSRRHRGRVMIKLRDPTTASLDVLPRMTYLSNGSYLVVCDGSSFGIEVAAHLVTRGARKLMVHIPPNYVDVFFYTKVASWRKQGVTVNVSSENLQNKDGCATLIRDVTSLDPVKGIFVAHVSSEGKSLQTTTQDDFCTQFNEKALIVANLDLVSRNICSELSHFVVIIQLSSEAPTAFVNSMSQKICQERITGGFPALCFQIGLLDEFEKDYSNISRKLKPQPLKEIFNALDASLKLEHHNVSSYSLKKTTTDDFIESIAKIIGIKDIDKVPETLKIGDFGVSEVNVEEIKTIIKHEMEEIYTNQKIKDLSIIELKQIKNNYKIMTKFDSGLGAFYTYIDKDECLATEPLIAMPTKLTDATENEEELDPKATYLMLIPGFEGHHEMFTTVCERLKVQAMMFQLGPDITDASIPEIAAYVMEFIKKRFELKSKFYLLGYSFGVNVALELAALMEKEGHVGIVFCLDSSPDALKLQMDAYLENLTENELQNSIVEHLYELMAGERSEELREELIKCEEWQQKVEAGVHRLRSLVHFSNQYKRTLIQTAYNRIILSKTYQPTIKLDSEIVLLKGTPHPKMGAIPYDYNLSKYSRQPVKIYDLESDHAMAPHDCRVSNIINKHLDPKILTDFKNKNLCESYYADPLKTF